MKKTTATIYSPAMELTVINKRSVRRNRRRIVPTHIVPPPSEVLIEKLNRLGQEYPFCVCFKAKAYDTL